jgi:hypothetical protein
MRQRYVVAELAASTQQSVVFPAQQVLLAGAVAGVGCGCGGAIHTGIGPKTVCEAKQ